MVVQIDAGWPYEKGAIAVTTSAYDTRTGLVVDADIEINSQEFKFVVADDSCDPEAGTMDIRNALTHEVGPRRGAGAPSKLSALSRRPPCSPRAPPCETKKAQPGGG